MNKRKSKKREIELFIENFQNEFLKKFGVVPRISYTKSNLDLMPTMSLKELVKIGNEILEEICPGLFPAGLGTKMRKRELVVIRQCGYKLAIEMGYSLAVIGKFFGLIDNPFDHATVLHGKREVIKLLDTKDLLTLRVMTLYITKIRTYNETNIQFADPKQTKS